jgi:hypothetical protein
MLTLKTVVQIERELGFRAGLTMQYGWNWQFYVARADLVYCEFRVEELAQVESNLILAVDKHRSNGDRRFVTKERG